MVITGDDQFPAHGPTEGEDPVRAVVNTALRKCKQAEIPEPKEPKEPKEKAVFLRGARESH